MAALLTTGPQYTEGMPDTGQGLNKQFSELTRTIFISTFPEVMPAEKLSYWLKVIVMELGF